MINDKPSSIGLSSATNAPVVPSRSPAAQVSAPAVPASNSSEPQAKSVTTTDEIPSNPIKATEKETTEPKTASQSEVSKARMEEMKEKVTQAIPRVRELMQKNQRSLDFEVAEEENRVIITVIDKETDKVIRQIPPEDLLQIAQSIDQGIDAFKGGAILNSRA